MKEQIAQQPSVAVKRASTTPEERMCRLYPPASPHYSGHAAGIHGENQPHPPDEWLPRQTDNMVDADVAAIGDALAALLSSLRQRGHQPYQYQEEAETREAYHIGVPRSAIRYTSSAATRTQAPPPVAQIPRRTTHPPFEADKEERPTTRRHVHWLVLVGLAMLIMVLGWVVFTTVASWWQITQDDWHYGRPRTFQMDAVVGQNDSAAHPSHFIALNLNSHIEVIEFPGGDATHARIYLGPTLIGDDGQVDLAPVTLSFRDVNGDGKPDMLIHVQGSTFVFINDHGTFRPARPGEPVHLPD